MSEFTYDLFICHASEDKEELVKPLAKDLELHGIKVFYDEISLTLGDNLRKKIDEGIQKSRFAVVVFSQAFFAKEWPEYELDGLIQRQIKEGKFILPIWHGISRDDFLHHSPFLANLSAIKTEKGLKQIVLSILEVLKPENYIPIKQKVKKSPKLSLSYLKETPLIFRIKNKTTSELYPWVTLTDFRSWAPISEKAFKRLIEAFSNYQVAFTTESAGGGKTSQALGMMAFLEDLLNERDLSKQPFSKVMFETKNRYLGADEFQFNSFYYSFKEKTWDDPYITSQTLEKDIKLIAEADWNKHQIICFVLDDLHLVTDPFRTMKNISKICDTLSYNANQQDNKTIKIHTWFLSRPLEENPFIEDQWMENAKIEFHFLLSCDALLKATIVDRNLQDLPPYKALRKHFISLTENDLVLTRLALSSWSDLIIKTNDPFCHETITLDHLKTLYEKILLSTLHSSINHYLQYNKRKTQRFDTSEQERIIIKIGYELARIAIVQSYFDRIPGKKLQKRIRKRLGGIARIIGLISIGKMENKHWIFPHTNLAHWYKSIIQQCDDSSLLKRSRDILNIEIEKTNQFLEKKFNRTNPKEIWEELWIWTILKSGKNRWIIPQLLFELISNSNISSPYSDYLYPDTNGNLISIDLSNKQRTNQPESTDQLDQFYDLDLIDLQLTQIPETIKQHTHLQDLDFTDNLLTSLPDTITHLTQLRSLNLSDNQLTNFIDAITRLTQLKDLDLSSNRLTHIPETIGHLKELQNLDLADNKLTQIPDTITHLTELKSLNLWNNQLKHIPETIGHLEKLQNLNISYNQLIDVPESIKKLNRLKQLNLSYNKLKKIPNSLKSLKYQGEVKLLLVGNPLKIKEGVFDT
ncbi:MAG: TIR domain-containing protein [Promethearchaeota archaeon]